MYKIMAFWPDGRESQIDSVKTIKEMRKSISKWFKFLVSSRVPKKDFHLFTVVSSEVSSDDGCLFHRSLYLNSKDVYLSVYCKFF